MKIEQMLFIFRKGEENNKGGIKDYLEDGWMVVCATPIGNEIHYILQWINES